MKSEKTKRVNAKKKSQYSVEKIVIQCIHVYILDHTSVHLPLTLCAFHDDYTNRNGPESC